MAELGLEFPEAALQGILSCASTERRSQLASLASSFEHPSTFVRYVRHRIYPFGQQKRATIMIDC